MVIDISSIKDGEVVLVLTTANKYIGTTTDILKLLINKKKYPCLYVTINKPYKVLLNILKRNNINTNKIFFIDLISKMTRTEMNSVKNCLFISSPESLTELSIAVSESIKNMPGKNKFMFFDSLSTLLIYNQTGTVTKFAHFISGKMKAEGVETIIISMEKEMDEKLISQVSAFVDKVMKVNNS